MHQEDANLISVVQNCLPGPVVLLLLSRAMNMKLLDPPLDEKSPGEAVSAAGSHMDLRDLRIRAWYRSYRHARTYARETKVPPI